MNFVNDGPDELFQVDDGEHVIPKISFAERPTIVAGLDVGYEQLTTDNALLLLIDHQIGPLWELEFGEPRRRVVDLARFASGFGIPIVITAIGVESLGPIIPELTSVADDAPHIVRDVVNAWEDCAVRGAVTSTSRDKLIVAGSAADIGVALCARAAARDGYAVYAPLDASSQFSHPTSAALSRDGVIITTTALVTKEISSSSRRRRIRIRSAAPRSHP